jgi:hypothetical protein
MANWAKWIAWLVVGFWALSGAWAFVAPRSFYDQVATFPPYNVHFIHDIGAFSIGLGAALALVMVMANALRAVLLAVAIGSTLHVLSHVLDYDIKPSVADIAGLSLFTALTWVAAFAVVHPVRSAET